jgi:hypothetical protein
MRFVIGAVAILVLGSIFGSLAGMLFWPDLSYATSSVTGMRLERHNMFLHTNRHHRPLG